MSPQAEQNVRIANQARMLRLNPKPTYGPGTNIWALEGLSGLNDCCAAGSLGCCDMARQFTNGNGESDLSGLRGMSDFTGELVDAVKGALAVIPGASYIGATPDNVQMLYDTMTGAKAEEIQAKVKKYNDRAVELNNALDKVNAIHDIAQRTSLRSQQASLVSAQADYGKVLLGQIESYNALCDKIGTATAGEYAPDQISAYSLSQLSMPTLSGYGLGFVQMIPIAIIAVAIAAILYMAMDTVQAYMNYDLRSRGIEPGLDERYSGFMGMINRISDTGGDLMKVGLVVGAAVLGWMIWKKRGPFAAKPETLREVFLPAPKAEVAAAPAAS